MIKLQGKLPRRVYLACSGGVDSMAALDFLRRNHDVHVLHFDHGTEHGRQAKEFVEQYCMRRGIPITTGETMVPYLRVLAEKNGGENSVMLSSTSFLETPLLLVITWMIVWKLGCGAVCMAQANGSRIVVTMWFVRFVSLAKEI